MIVQFVEPTNIVDLYPLTLTRPAADLRCGILTLAEKWVFDLNLKREEWGYLPQLHLQHTGGSFNPVLGATMYIVGNILPNEPLVSAIQSLKGNESLWHEGSLIAATAGAYTLLTDAQFDLGNIVESAAFAAAAKNIEISVAKINRPFSLFVLNGKEIQNDFIRITANRDSGPLSNTNRILGEYPIFIEEGATIECSILNASEGPIYIGKNAQIMEGCMIRGPFAMCEGAVLKMGCKVYNATTLGPYSVAGGEISNVVFWGFSNKGHDGFLGNSVLGEWCNMGADTNSSNLKNTYDEVKVWNYTSQKFELSGQQFCGLIMGDHSKCGINTMFNTGTVVGVACNVFGAGFPRQFVPDFSWGGAQGFVTHTLDAVHKTAELVMPRRQRKYTESDKRIIESVFGQWAKIP
ncbi:MAG: glucose-1-phosphate thymidylyltransferase [Flavobacteriaceae bacterium]|nr:glucose-1-phosphate thymidylyltransferase [Flavobacteriaceae bacterium]